MINQNEGYDRARANSVPEGTAMGKVSRPETGSNPVSGLPKRTGLLLLGFGGMLLLSACLVCGLVSIASSTPEERGVVSGIDEVRPNNAEAPKSTSKRVYINGELLTSEGLVYLENLIGPVSSGSYLLDREGVLRTEDGRFVASLPLSQEQSAGNARMPENNQADQIASHLVGSEYVFTNMSGLYGTSYQYNIHFCSSGYYILHGIQFRQSTVASYDSTWTEQGIWRVEIMQGQVTLQLHKESGEPWYFPISIRSNGQMALTGNWNIGRVGPASC